MKTEKIPDEQLRVRTKSGDEVHITKVQFKDLREETQQWLKDTYCSKDTYPTAVFIPSGRVWSAVNKVIDDSVTLQHLQLIVDKINEHYYAATLPPVYAMSLACRCCGIASDDDICEKCCKNVYKECTAPSPKDTFFEHFIKLSFELEKDRVEGKIIDFEAFYNELHTYVDNSPILKSRRKTVLNRLYNQQYELVRETEKALERWLDRICDFM